MDVTLRGSFVPLMVFGSIKIMLTNPRWWLLSFGESEAL